MIKIVGFLLLIVVLIFVSGMSGVLFAIWPTGFPDQSLEVSQSEVDQLREIRIEAKFNIDKKTFYPGAKNEVERVELEILINKVIDELISNLPKTPKKSYVLSVFKRALVVGNSYDSEDRDMISKYLTRIMDILKIQSSNELINVWRYGFPYGWFS